MNGTLEELKILVEAGADVHYARASGTAFQQGKTGYVSFYHPVIFGVEIYIVLNSMGKVCWLWLRPRGKKTWLTIC